MAVLVRPCLTARVGIAGIGLWLATSPGGPALAPPVAAAAVQLTSVGSPLVSPPLTPASAPRAALFCPGYERTVQFSFKLEGQ
jgi:hypothetical protein